MTLSKNQNDRLESLAKFLNLMSEKLKDAEAKADVEQVVTELGRHLVRFGNSASNERIDE